jgi:predicted Zn-dependent protease
MPERSEILSRDYILSTFKKALEFSNADQTEIVLESEELSLTRFADSKITQNLTTADNKVIVRTIDGKRIGVSVSNSLDLEDLKRTVRAAHEISSVQKPDEDFISLPQSPAALPSKAYHEATAGFSPVDRADAIGKINDVGKKDNLLSSGANRITTDRAAVVNSLGTEQFFEGTNAELSLTLSGDNDNSGYAIGYNRDVNMIDPVMLAEKAADKAVRSVDPVKLDSGPYTVILEPPAVGQMVLLLSFLGFGCKSFITRRSFMAGNIGRQIVGSNITLIEDPYNERIQGMPFGYEGVPRQQVYLIENGIARGVVWNSYFAGIAGEKSTGHAHPAYKTFSPYPKNLVMGAGENSVEEMIASTERGIYITHFWYVNYLNPMRTMVTGTTLDGTFLIENGKLTKPIVNMRMAQSIQEMLQKCSMISAERQLYPQYSVVMLLPYLKVEDFNLSVEEG